jgi:hypothetical protein
MTHYVQDCLRLTRFIWADKAALFVGVLFSSVLLCFWSLAFLVVGSRGAEHLWGYLGILGLKLEILVVGSVWFVMRVTDFLAGGSTYRLFDHKSAPKDVGIYRR